MTVNVYTVGAKIRLAALFAVDSVETDPTVVTFKMEKPDGSVQTYVYGTDAQLVKDATGYYHVDWLTALQGAHTYRFAGTGTVCPAAAEGQFRTQYSPF